MTKLYDAYVNVDANILEKSCIEFLAWNERRKIEDKEKFFENRRMYTTKNHFWSKSRPFTEKEIVDQWENNSEYDWGGSPEYRNDQLNKKYVRLAEVLITMCHKSADGNVMVSNKVVESFL